MPAAEQLCIYATMPSLDVAKHIIHTLVEERLLACATLLPHAHSFYWWENTVQEEQEVAVLGKTTPACYAALEKRFIELHPYTVPCLVALPITTGFAPYLHWIESETRNLS